MTKRILLFLLVLSLLLAVSCNQAQTPTTDTTTNSDTSDTTDTTETTTTTRTVCPPGRPRKDFKLRAHVQDANANGFEAEDDGTTLNQAICKRNEDLEGRVYYDKVYYDITFGDFDQWTIETEMQSLKDNYSYDVVASAAPLMVRLAVEGMLYDLTSLYSIDLGSEYYDARYNEAFNVGGRQYLVTGKFTLSWYRYQMACFFNRNIFKDAELNYPYDDVLAQQWTAEKMMQYSAKFYQDTNQNGAYDTKDRFGLYMFVGTGSSQTDGFMNAFNLRLVEKDADGYFKMIDIDPSTWGSAIENFAGLLQGNGAWCKNDVGIDGVENKFIAGEAGFIFNCFSMTERTDVQRLGRLKEGYGVLPLPKANSDQESYYTYITEQLLAFGIPHTLCEGDDPHDAAYFLDQFAYESYKTVSPTYEDKMLTKRYIIDERSKPMIDIILSGVVVDPVNVYYGTYLPLTTGSFRAVYDGTKTVGEILESRHGITFEENLNALNQALRALDAALKEKDQTN